MDANQRIAIEVSVANGELRVLLAVDGEDGTAALFSRSVDVGSYGRRAGVRTFTRRSSISACGALSGYLEDALLLDAVIDGVRTLLTVMIEESGAPDEIGEKAVNGLIDSAANFVFWVAAQRRQADPGPIFQFHGAEHRV